MAVLGALAVVTVVAVILEAAGRGKRRTRGGGRRDGAELIEGLGVFEIAYYAMLDAVAASGVDFIALRGERIRMLARRWCCRCMALPSGHPFAGW